MKKFWCIIIGLSSMHAHFLHGQTLNQSLQAGVDLGYAIEQTDNSLSEQAGNVGFGVEVNYALGGRNLSFLSTPYIYLMQGEDLAGMKSIYKKKNITLTEYDGGTYYSAGFLFGLQYTFWGRDLLDVPDWRLALQYGFVNCNLPAIMLVYDTPETQGVMQRSDAVNSLGAAWKLAFGADVLRSGNAIYSADISIRRESANIPMMLTSNITTPQMDVFAWKAYFLQLTLGVRFNIE